MCLCGCLLEGVIVWLQTESTGLMYAAYNNHVACVKQLLQHGADITAQNEDGYTAIDLAVGQNLKASKCMTMFLSTCKY